MYLVGSLALGDFNPQTSDIDSVVATQTRISDRQYDALKKMHVQLDTGSLAGGRSPWASRVEAVYLPLNALRQAGPNAKLFPQVEKGTLLFMAHLEKGWAFQLNTLWKHSVVVTGPHPHTFMLPVSQVSLRQAAAAIASDWEELSRQDREWLAWIQQNEAQSFVVLTLCRMLYSVVTGDVASKPAAAQWAKTELGMKWSGLIDQALENQHDHRKALEEEVTLTLELIRLTLDKCQVK